MVDEEFRTVYCTNLSDQVSEEILYELFLQAGPVERVSLPKDNRGETRGFAFVTFSHDVSVPYSIELFAGTKLFNRHLSLKPRSFGHQTTWNPPLLNPEAIEASNPLTNPLRGGFNPSNFNSFNNLMPSIAIQQNLAGNPFQAIPDPNLLLALSANFQPGANFSHLGMYNSDESRDRGGSKMNRERGSNRPHHGNNPYKDRSNDHYSREKDWVNNGNNRHHSKHNRRRM